MRNKSSGLIRKSKFLERMILSLMMVFLPVFSNLAIVKAGLGDVHTVETTNAYGQWKLKTRPAGLAYGYQSYITVDGQAAFCLEPEKGASSGPNQEVSWSSIGIDDDLMRQLTRIAYYGYRSQPTITNYFLTQNLIWKILMSGKSWQLYCASDHYDSLSAMQPWFDEVLEKVNRYEVKPSFSGLSYQLKVGETLELQDQNGVLQDCFVEASDGLDVLIVGDTLRITATKDAQEHSKITFTKDDALSSGEATFVVKNGNSQAVSVLIGKDAFEANVQVQVEKYGELKLRKEDDSNNLLDGAVFLISGPSLKEGQEVEIKNGEVVLKDLLPGTYRIQEVEAPKHFLLEKKDYEVEVVGGQTVVFTMKDRQPTGTFELEKWNQDQSFPLQGVTYRLWNKDNEWVATTDETGKITISDLPIGHYFYQESQAADGYLIDETIYEFDIDFLDETTEVIVYQEMQINQEPLGEIHLRKEDRETGSVSQGDASLNGAVYGLFAKEDIVNCAQTTTFYKKNEKVASFQFDADGKSQPVKGLPLGQYYVKEIEAPLGYLLDETSYDVDLTYQDPFTALVVKELVVKEQVKKRAFQIVKFASDGTTGIVPSLVGAEFSVKLQSEVDQKGFEEATLYDLLITDGQGQACSKELPFGDYLVRETKVPENHLPVPDFKVSIQEDNRDPLPLMLLNDAPFEAYLRMVKKDAISGKTVLLAGTTFKIKNLDSGEYVEQKVGLLNKVSTFTTDETGRVSTPLKLACGHYQLEEIKAPDGYALNTNPVLFTIEQQGGLEVDEDGDPIVTVQMVDERIQGKLTIQKFGEVLTNYRNGQFIYEKQGLAHAKFELYAQEDILSPDNQGDLLFEKDSLVATLSSNEEGVAISEALPLGKYYLKEVETPDGYVSGEKTWKVELSSDHQAVEMVIENLEIENLRQKIDLSILKQDAHSKKPLVGATFSLYAKNDIYADDQRLLVPAGTLLEVATSNQSGEIHFTKDLPLATYLVKETGVPLGYVSQNIEITVDASKPKGEEAVISYQKTVENSQTTIAMSKQDVTTGQELPGACLELWDTNGHLIDKWISSTQPHIFYGLYVGETYILKETNHPYGFALSQQINFVVEDTLAVQKIVMVDELVTGKVAFKKTGDCFTQVKEITTAFGKAYLPIFEKQTLKDASITIYAAEDICLANGVVYYQKNTPIQVLKSEEEIVYSNPLPVGKYYALETAVPVGYIQDYRPYYFEIVDNGILEMQILPLEIYNEKAQVQIDLQKVLEKGNSHEDSSYADVKFGLFTRYELDNDLNEHVLDQDCLIAVCDVDEDGRLQNVPELPIGHYYLKELSTHSDYQLDASEYDFVIEYQGKDVQTYTISINDGKEIVNELKRGQIEIEKVDQDNQMQRLSGALFSLYDEHHHLLETVSSQQDGKVIFANLEYGKYYLKEIQAPVGYVKNEEEMELTIHQSNPYQLVIKNQKTPMIQTADQSSIKEYLHLILISMFFGGFLKLYQKKKL